MSSYKFIIIPFITVIVSQLIKCITDKEGRFNLLTFFNLSGGMPSSHSSLVCSLTTIIYLKYGLSSPIFALSLFFSLIILYDSRGVRYETGKQSKLLNEIISERNDISYEKLQEKIGHKPIEVVCGSLLGIVMGFLLYNLF